MKIIFDFDGTLVNTMPALTGLGTDLISGYGFSESEAREKYLSCIGMSFPEQLDELFPDDKRNASFAETFYDFQSRIYETAALHDYAAAVLGHLAYIGVPFAICTSSPATLAQNLLMQFSLPRPDAFYGREFGRKLRQLVHLSSNGYTHFIGDAPHDGDCADAAGFLEFVGVEHTFPREVFKNRNFNSAPDLLSAVSEVIQGPVHRGPDLDTETAGNSKSSS